MQEWAANKWKTEIQSESEMSTGERERDGAWKREKVGDDDIYNN